MLIVNHSVEVLKLLAASLYPFITFWGWQLQVSHHQKIYKEKGEQPWDS